jgi:hypothetical protein
MIKQYITWDRFKVSESQYIHPTFGVENLFIGIKFNELGFCDGQDKYLGYMEGDEAIILEVIDYFKIHNIIEITPEQALQFCIDWYNSTDFELDTDGFTIIDNRPKDIL